MTPKGVPAELHYTGLTTFELADDEDDFGGWYADFPGQRHPAGYVLTAVGRPFDVIADFVVHPVNGWGYYDTIMDTLIREGWFPPAPTPEELATCSHGLSLALCADPVNHYPMEARV